MMLEVLLILLLIVLSAFFSGTEIIYNTVSGIRLQNMAEETGKRVYRIALDITGHFADTLCTILIGNNLVNIAASSVGTVLFLRLFSGNEGLASVVSTLVLTVFILIFGETAPKILAREHADTLVKYVTYPIRAFSYLLFPIVFAVMKLIVLLQKLWKPKKKTPLVTEDELSSLIDTVEEEGVIDEDQSELLQSTIAFSDTAVGEIMTPRIDMIYLDIEDDPEEILSAVENSPYSRIPVYEDTVDNIIGILYLNRFYKAMTEVPSVADLDLRSLLMEPLLLHKTMKLPAALARMRKEKTHIAIVTDEYGGTDGIVTMEDILEELVGDIWDENDDIVTELTRVSDTDFTVSGDMNIDDFFEEIEYEPKDFECEYTTVGGWAIEKLEADPHVGDAFHEGRLFVRVTEMDDMRVTSLAVHLEPEVKETEENID